MVCDTCYTEMHKGANMQTTETRAQEKTRAGRARIGFSLTAEAQRLLRGLKDKHGVTQNALVELAIREKAERDGVQ